MRLSRYLLLTLMMLASFSTTSMADEPVPLTAQQVERERDVIYHRFEGVALTMDVFKPENPNGAAIVKIVSGGWKSNHRRVKDNFSKPYTDHGYTVFAVVHGSQPRYKVRDIMGFMHRAVRFIRKNADRWQIDPDRIGVTGSSAGGHLSLVLATKGTAGDPNAKDPAERASSEVQAAAVFYPPTDYRNWAEAGDMAVGVGKQAKWQPAFGSESATAEGREALGRHMSSIYHVSASTPPVFIIHGDTDEVVPLYQATSSKKLPVKKERRLKLSSSKAVGTAGPTERKTRNSLYPGSTLTCLGIQIQSPLPSRMRKFPNILLAIGHSIFNPKHPLGCASSMKAVSRKFTCESMLAPPDHMKMSMCWAVV